MGAVRVLRASWEYLKRQNGVKRWLSPHRHAQLDGTTECSIEADSATHAALIGHVCSTFQCVA